jgi:MinD-like ATPase involved in chromosome partitioning or flagellar assembly
VIGVLLAIPGIRQEPDLVVSAPAAGFRVIRRCVDAVDLFAAAAADPESPIIVSVGLPRLGADVIERLSTGAGRTVVGIAGCDDDLSRLHDLGVLAVVRAGPIAEATWRAVAALLAGSTTSSSAGAVPAGVWATGCWDGATASLDPPVAPAAPLGRLVAVWGPAGAPGRTTVAIGVAEALSDDGHRSCIVDADTYGPAVAMALGVVEDASGLVVACRHADAGPLAASTLLGVSRRIRGDLHLLGGLSRPDRWPDLRQGALDRVWQACREAFDVTVIDVGFCVEDDETAGPSGSPWGRRRNAAALSALGACDHVIVVADSSPLGAARLAGAWPAIDALAPGAGRIVVQNRTRGRRRERRQSWADGVREAGITAPVLCLSSDAEALQTCWANGRTLAEGARRSPMRRSFAALAAEVVSG